LKITKYSIGLGDRFGREGKALLRAVRMARENGAEIAPVWNKSFREHTITGSSPSDVRTLADQAAQALSWDEPYFVDADHVTMDTVDPFIKPCDYFTIDVTSSIDRLVKQDEAKAFVDKYKPYRGKEIPAGIEAPMVISRELMERTTAKYLYAAREAGRVYRHIESARGKGNFITEVSLDETSRPQTPREIFIILAALNEEGVPIQAIAPKFPGRFNKGVDYVGNPEDFAGTFDDMLHVIRFAKSEFDLPPGLKISIHSGSDKFSLYPLIRETLAKHDTGIHVKTAGTTWLEEMAQIAESGREGWEIAFSIYQSALDRFEAFYRPYQSVIDIDPFEIPPPPEVNKWGGKQFAAALRHDPSSDAFNPSLRQFIHVAYGAAAEMGNRFLDALEKYRDGISEAVTRNMYENHIRHIFPGIEPKENE